MKVERKTYNRYSEERSKLVRNVNELSKKVDAVYKSITEPIELKNGETYYKTQREAIKDSWERINVVQRHLDRLDDRTQVLDDIQKLFASFREAKSRSSKLIKPVGKFLYKGAIVVIGLYLLSVLMFHLLAGRYDEVLRILKSLIGLF